MIDTICLLELPKNSPFKDALLLNEKGAIDAGQLVQTFGPLVVRNLVARKQHLGAVEKLVRTIRRLGTPTTPTDSPATPGLLTYDTNRNIWVDEKRQPLEQPHLDDVSEVTKARCETINTAVARFTQLQAEVGHRPIKFLTLGPARSPDKFGSLNVWRRNHTDWLTNRIKEIDKAAKQQPYGAAERHFRAAANMLVGLKRLTAIRLALS